ncbi:uncharacterized protein [Rutidosis leptorrhynchoides]|uniref:uncharacterized protein n=1 Tax=Rutidosis leptorrhynchoides TaxID=125765 RepID=UPI003A9A11F7
MVYLHSSIPANRYMNMARLSKKPSVSACKESPSALIDLIILMAVICASGFLIYPYVTILLFETIEIIEPIMDMVEQEVFIASMIYTVLGLSIIAMIMLTITLCKSSSKCGQLGCRGLHKAVEFDLWIEAEDFIKKSNSTKEQWKKGLFNLPKDRFRELETELKKVAPANGRVVVVFRGKCGCPVVRFEVYGPKKSNRKVKK